MNSLGPGAHGPWPARCVRPSLPPPLSSPLLWLGAYTLPSRPPPRRYKIVHQCRRSYRGPSSFCRHTGGPCRAPRRRLRSHVAGARVVTCRSMVKVKTTSRSPSRPASIRTSIAGTSRSRRCQCPPLATACGAFRWQTRQSATGHPRRGRRRAQTRPGGASGLCIRFWQGRRQARHVRRQ